MTKSRVTSPGPQRQVESGRVASVLCCAVLCWCVPVPDHGTRSLSIQTRAQTLEAESKKRITVATPVVPAGRRVTPLVGPAPAPRTDQITPSQILELSLLLVRDFGKVYRGRCAFIVYYLSSIVV